MFAREIVLSPAGRATALATVAALVLTAAVPSVASAAAPRAKGASVATSGATDFSARRRGVGGAAAAAAFAGIVGTGIAIAAAQNRRANYDEYYGGPVYAAPQPYYYGGDAGYYGGGGYGPGPHGYGTSVPYVNGHPIAGW